MYLAQCLKYWPFASLLLSCALFAAQTWPASAAFSGPRQQPFVCQTQINGLGPALNADCDAPRRVQFYYKPKDLPAVPLLDNWKSALVLLEGKSAARLPPGFKTYDPEHPATDVAQTVTRDGKTVPYIVRREIGVINRAIYDLRFLHVPGQPLPEPNNRQESAWNGRLVYVFSGGCAAGFRQGVLLGPASDEVLLAKGYAVVTSTFNIGANNCNDVLSAETVALVKKYFAGTFGIPIHTIGWGESVGGMQQYLIAQNYAGLLDGIIPYISFPDWPTYIAQSTDCALLNRAITHSRLQWTQEQKSAVSGFATFRTCAATGGSYPILPRTCNVAIPVDQTYDPIDRPRGARCGFFDNEINAYGVDERTGFAARPLDNTGVQYGLVAFETGVLDAERFIELNELAGGFDTDGNIVAARTEADAQAVRRAYQRGLVLTGGGGLASLPIIDWRWYSDDQGDNHDSFHSYVTRARLIAANGSAANQVMLIDSRANTSVMTFIHLTDPNPQTSLVTLREEQLVGSMDRWLDRVDADHGVGRREAKIARNKPPELREGCWATDGARVEETLSYHKGRCASLYPTYGNPRTAAGGPITDDLLKCTLKPVNGSDYFHSLSPEQLARLKRVFPQGVCDYSRPGLGQRPGRHAASTPQQP